MSVHCIDSKEQPPWSLYLKYRIAVIFQYGFEEAWPIEQLFHDLMTEKGLWDSHPEKCLENIRRRFNVRAEFK